MVFDLCRMDLLKQLHVPLPKNLEQEVLLWAALNDWVYRHVPPWESLTAEDKVIGDHPGKHPFPYDFGDKAKDDAEKPPASDEPRCKK